MNILISGASGMVGKEVIKKLVNNGHSVRKLVRKSAAKPDEFEWNICKKQIDEKAFENLDCIIHLAGANIGKRWTKEYKKELYSSRIDSTLLLADYCSKHNIHLQSFISASGISFYGTFTSDKILNENDGLYHKDFLSLLSQDWEKAADKFNENADRIVKFRISPVLSKEGGSFEKLKEVTDFNLASGLGSGKQWFNWVHLDDLTDMIVFSVENSSINGAYNAVADEISTQREFMNKLAKAKDKFFFPMNVPAFVLKPFLGEMSEIVLKGTRVSNGKIKSEGFKLSFPDLDSVFKNLL